MATVSQQIQQIYIGLLGRAADQAGLDYWTAEIEGGVLTLEQLRANIVNEQPEYAAGQGSMTRPQAVADLYENLFNRAPEAAGLEYWVSGGGASVNIDQLVLALINGASASDQLVLDNKTEVAEYYTAAAGADYSADAAAGAVANVDGTRDSVDAAKTAIDSGAVATGQTYTLTAGAEAVEGDAGNNTITGVSSALSSARTLDAGDKIDGGAGNDTLKVDLQSSFAGFTKDQGFLKNVETVELTNSGTIQRTFAAKEVTGVNEYVLKGNTAGVDLTDLAAIPTSVTISGQKSGSSTLSFATDVTKGTADAMTVKLNSVGTAEVKNAAGTVTTAQAAVTVTANGIETVTVDAAGTVVAALAGTDTKALKVTGAGDLKLTNIQAGVKTVDAGAATGAVDINLANASDVTAYTGSAGNDTIRASAGDFAANAKIAGGAGQDVLKTSATGTVQYEMSGVETVELANTGTALTFSAAKTTGLEKIVVSKDANQAATFVSMGAGNLTVDLEQTGANADLSVDNAGTVTANVKVTSAATATATQTSAGDLTASKATAVTLNVAKFGNYTGVVDAAVATEATLNVDGQLSNAELKAAKATAATITDTNADLKSTLKLTTAELKNLTIKSAGEFEVAGSSSLNKVEALTIEAGKAFSLGTNTLNAINSLTLSGANAASAVTLGTLGSSTLGYGINLNATGLKAGLTVSDVDTGAGNAINLNVAGVTGNVSIGSGQTISVAAADGKNTGSVTVNAATVAGSLTLGAITAQTISVDASGVLGAVSVGKLTGDTITFNAGGALATVAATQAEVGKSLTYTGAELTSNSATIDIAGTDVNLFLKGGLQTDTFTVSSFEATTGAQKVTVTGDLGLGSDKVSFDLSGLGVSAATVGDIELNLSGLAGADVEVLSVNASQAAKNFTYAGVNGSDMIDLSALDIASSGVVKINLFANDGAADTVKFGSAVATTGHKAFEITGFEAGTTGSDVISFAQGLFDGFNASGTVENAATGTGGFTEFAKGGVGTAQFNSTDKVFFEVSGTGDLAVGAGTKAADVWAVLAGTATQVANVSAGADKLFIVDDGTDSFLWVYNSSDATASASDLKLIGVVKGVTDFAADDFSIVA